MTTFEILTDAKSASRTLSALTSKEKEKALTAMAQEIKNQQDIILSSNLQDIEEAKTKMSAVMLDRLMLNEKRIDGMIEGIISASKLEDPVGKVTYSVKRDNGLLIEKVSVPFGVVAIIYESRPNVTSDAAALCIKSGNACVLRSGRDAYRSCKAITLAMRKGLEKAGFSPDFVSIVDDPSRQSANDLMCAKGLVDLLIPRGGKGLIRSVVENAKVPCIETGTGICHIYVDKSADLCKAVNIINNAKTQRPSVCNAEEVLLVHKDIAGVFLPMIKEKLITERLAKGLVPVEMRLCERALQFIDGKEAGEDDFDTEFLDYILAVKVVDSVKEATDHIAAHSTHHSEAIISGDDESINYFKTFVDSAAVYINASTRFTDGGEFGFGCEMGISTQKLHARGPMGLEALCTYKYVIHGDGQVR